MSTPVTSRVVLDFRKPEPPRPAADLVAEIRERGGRVYRMKRSGVFCLTDDAELAEWLLKQGARPYAPRSYGGGLDGHAPGAFLRERGGKIEYDIWIHPIKVSEGDLWEVSA